MTSTYVFVALVGLYTAVAAIFDLRTKRIPNYLTVPAAVLGLLYHSFAPDGWGIGLSLAGFGIGFSLLLLPWLLGGGGMGDVKLLGALGAWLGPVLMLVAFGTSVVFAAIGAAIVITVKLTTDGISRTHERHLALPSSDDRQVNKKRRRMMPFAVPVALSTWCVLLWMVTRGPL